MGMMNGRKQKAFLGLCFILSLMLFLTSCSYPDQKIIDDIQIPTILGFDKGEEDFIGTASYIDFTKEENDGNEVFLEAGGKSTRTILQKIDAQSSKPIEIGKLNLLLFGSELASEGVSYFISTICRDPLIGSNMFLAVSEGKAGELLRNRGQKINSNYIYNLIEHNSKDQNLPLPTLHSFLFDYYGEGRDGALPYLQIQQKNMIEVNGLAVFKNDQVKLILNRKESFLYKILKGRNFKGQAEFEIQKGDKKGVASFTLLHGENKKTIDKSENKVKFNIKLQGRVEDYPEWLDLSEAKNNIFLKNEMKKRLKEDLENLLFKFKDYSVDPLGIGDLVRSHSPNWDEKEFYQNAYENVTYDVDLNIELVRAGIGE